MKTREELSALKEEIETLNKKLRQLTEEELAQVTGGLHCGIYIGSGSENADKVSPARTTSWFAPDYQKGK